MFLREFCQIFKTSLSYFREAKTTLPIASKFLFYYQANLRELINLITNMMTFSDDLRWNKS